MFQHQANVKEPPTEESGTEEINNQGKDKKEEVDAQYAWDLGEVRL